MAIERQHSQIFCGKRGSSKSTFARAYWISQAPWRICIDVKHDIELPGVPQVESPSEIRHFPTVHLMAPRPDDSKWLDEVYDVAFQEGDCLLWNDEMSMANTANSAPDGQRRYVIMGRSRLCGHIGCTPSPVDIWTGFRKQAEHVYTGLLEEENDFKIMAPLLGIPRWRDLYDFMYEDVPGELTPRIRLPRFHMIGRDDEHQLHFLAPPYHPDELTQRIAELHFGPYDEGPSHLPR